MSCFSPRTNLKILLYHYGPNLAALFTRPIEVSGTIHMSQASRIWPCACSLSKNTVKQRIMDNGPLIHSCRKPKKGRKLTRETPYCSQWAGSKTAPPARDSYIANEGDKQQNLMAASPFWYSHLRILGTSLFVCLPGVHLQVGHW